MQNDKETTLDSKIEAILFFKSEPVSIKTLIEILSEKDVEIEHALVALEMRLAGGGIRLIRNGDSVMLGTAPYHGELLEKLQKEELNKNLGKAGLETLTIVLYQAPVSKSEIDYTRGVNSGFILRNLLVRGLVLRKVNEKDKRTFLYYPTIELLSFMGLSKSAELPEYGEVRQEIREFKKEFSENKDDQTVSSGENSEGLV